MRSLRPAACGLLAAAAAVAGAADDRDAIALGLPLRLPGGGHMNCGSQFDPLSESECRQAASQLGLPFRFHFRSKMLPGCGKADASWYVGGSFPWFTKDSAHVFWNKPDGRGESDGDYSPVCKDKPPPTMNPTSSPTSFPTQHYDEPAGYNKVGTGFCRRGSSEFDKYSKMVDTSNECAAACNQEESCLGATMCMVGTKVMCTLEMGDGSKQPNGGFTALSDNSAPITNARNWPDRSDPTDAHHCVCFAKQGPAIEACTASPCVHGSCVDAVPNAKTGIAFRCLGAACEGFSGVRCETEVNECTHSRQDSWPYALSAKTNPCGDQSADVTKAGGRCVDLHNAYMCVCDTKVVANVQVYAGDHCEVNVDDCVHNRCVLDRVSKTLNEYGCQDSFGDYVCQCTAGWAGHDCEVDIDSCSSNPCKNGGFCTDHPGAAGYSCTCPDGYVGSNCETEVNECANNPCHADGTDAASGRGASGCVDLINDFECVCQSGWRGKTCQTNINACEPNNPCANGGKCIDKAQGTGFVCECGDPSKWAGELCEINVDNCAGVTCSGHGMCHDSTTSIGTRTCACEAGYSGVNCETDIDDCASAPCQNGGTCTDLVNGYKCTCSAGWEGDRCQRDINGCQGEPCQGGKCIDKKAPAVGYTCECFAGNHGDNCENVLNACTHTLANGVVTPRSGDPCGNGDSGDCADLGLGKYACRCREGWTAGTAGANDHCDGPCDCSVNVDGCGHYKSLNGGKEPCQHGGTCADVAPPAQRDPSTGLMYVCQCPSGYTGDRCEVDIDACSVNPGDMTVRSNPCQNGGVCRDDRGGTGHTCQCSPGYSGDNCETDINECSPNPCHNGGNCTDLVNGYKCNCDLTGYSGSRCTVDIDMCQGQCGVNGHCTDFPGGAKRNYECVCKDGYKGLECFRKNDDGSCAAWDMCDINHDDCAGSPCTADHTEGSCIDLVNDYSCVCKRGWHGKNCELDVKVCPVFGAGEDPSAPKNAQGDANPCRNGGICHSNSDFGEDPHDNTLFDCECPRSTDGSRALWDGKMCEEKVDDCVIPVTINGVEHRPCHGADGTARGICHDKVGGHSCSCFAGFTGDNCENGVNECTHKQASDGSLQDIPNPCKNGGTCVDKDVGFECQCTADVWSGELCEVDVDACAAGPNDAPPCGQHGTCNDGKGVKGHTCTCHPGYVGESCRVEVNECAQKVEADGSATSRDNPCKNGGECADLVNGFKCSCPTGWLGETCEEEEDGCAAKPCHNGGTCKDHPGTRQPEQSCPTDQLSRPIVVDCFPPGSAVTQEMCTDRGCCWHPWDNGGSMWGTPWCYKPLPAQPAYTCQCAEGYEGENCETNIDDCASNPCGAHGTCYDANPAAAPWYTCVCAEGYSGTLCDQDIDECTQVRAADGSLAARASNPCGAHGTCSQTTPGSFACSCNNGWEGPFCGREIDGCKTAQACQNGGHCVDVKASALQSGDPATKYVCKCTADYHGDHCENKYDDCKDAQGQSKCAAAGTDAAAAVGVNGCVDKVRDFDCMCKSGWSGKTCEKNYDACKQNPCANGGKCEDLPTGHGFLCDCGDPTKWAGKVCEINVDNCAGVTCSGHGTCYDLTAPDVGKFRCDCDDGWGGDLCGTNEDDCTPNACNGHGTCRDLVDGFECECAPGWDGSACEVDVDGCAAGTPCGAHGHCEDVPAADYKPGDPKYHCRCHAGYKSDCAGSATCVVSQKGGRHSGPDCNVDIDECESAPCLNGGACRNLIDRYECVCGGTGFRGRNCEEEIDECQANPCQNGGRCEDLPAPQGYLCHCDGTGYEGTGTGLGSRHCDVKSIECTQDGAPACGPAGVSRCLELVGTYACECEDGYYVDRPNGPGSERCVELNECAEELVQGRPAPADPCNGNAVSCTDKVRGYECQCDSAHTGANCETDVNECTHKKEADGSLSEISPPCQNGGTCNNLVGAYECKCTQFWKGQHCLTPAECGRAGQSACESADGSDADEQLCMSEFVPSTDRKTCVDCGARGEPACAKGCDAGSVRNPDTGICEACGDDGMLACCEGCHEGCLDIHKCTPGNAFVHSDGRCYECGGPGQPHCLGPDGVGGVCDPGATKTKDKCVQCGGHNQAKCETKDPCLKHTVLLPSGKCWNCGRDGEPPCRGDWCTHGTVLGTKAGAKVCRNCGERGQPVCCDGAGCTSKTGRRGRILQSQVTRACAGSLVPTVSSGEKRCMDCGALGQSSCPGSVCREGLQSVGDVCLLCGRHDQQPCPGDKCSAGNVIDSFYKPPRCRQCGGRLQPPCVNGPACRTGLGALTGEGNSLVRCRQCGGKGQRPCPTGSASPGCEAGMTVSDRGWCLQCGDHAQATCDGGSCKPGNVAVGGRCTACGGHGMLPCSDGCAPGMTPSWKYCKPCGGEGQRPCKGACPAGKVLGSNGNCRTCAGSECVAAGTPGCGRTGQPSCQGGKASKCEQWNDAVRSGEDVQRWSTHHCKKYWGWKGSPWYFPWGWKTKCWDTHHVKRTPLFKCYQCGGDEQPVCKQWNPQCRNDGNELVGVHGTCHLCGQHRMPPCAGNRCGPGLSNQNGACRPCGLDGQPPCPGATPCSAGDWHQVIDGACTECGGNTQPACPSGARCRGGRVEHGGVCYPCGKQGQSPCLSSARGGAATVGGQAGTGLWGSGLLGKRAIPTDVFYCGDKLGWVHDAATGERTCQVCGAHGQAHCRTDTETKLKHKDKMCEGAWRYVGDDPNRVTKYDTAEQCRLAASGNPACGDHVMYMKKHNVITNVVHGIFGFVGKLFPQSAFGILQDQGTCICTPALETGELGECDPRQPRTVVSKILRLTASWDTYTRQQCRASHNAATDGTCTPCGGAGEEVCVSVPESEECAAGYASDRTQDAAAPSAASNRAALCVPCGGRMQLPCPTHTPSPGCRDGLEPLTTRDPPVCEVCGINGAPACAHQPGSTTTARRARQLQGGGGVSYVCKEKDTTPYQVSGVGSQTMFVCVPCGDHNQIACDRKANTLTMQGEGIICKKGMKMTDAVEVRRCYEENLFQDWQDKGTYTDHTPAMKDSGYSYAAGKSDDSGSNTTLVGILSAIGGALGALCTAGAVVAVRQKRAGGPVGGSEELQMTGAQDPEASMSQYNAAPQRSRQSPRGGSPRSPALQESASKRDVCDV